MKILVSLSEEVEVEKAIKAATGMIVHDLAALGVEPVVIPLSNPLGSLVTDKASPPGWSITIRYENDVVSYAFESDNSMGYTGLDYQRLVEEMKENLL
jgi:hypothetical protein